MGKRDRIKGPSGMVQQGPGAQPQAVSFSASRTEIRHLPKAAELQEYRDTDPRLYDLIVTEFQKNGEHRREMDAASATDRNIIVRAASRNDVIGLVGSWSFAVMCLAVGAYFVYTGKNAGALLGVLGLLPSIIGAFRRRG
jgi:hypothetical protein